MTLLPSRDSTGAVFVNASRSPVAIFASSASRLAAAPVGTSGSLVASRFADLLGAAVAVGVGSATGGGGVAGSDPVLPDEPQAVRNSTKRGRIDIERMRMARHVTAEIDAMGDARPFTQFIQ